MKSPVARRLVSLALVLVIGLSFFVQPAYASGNLATPKPTKQEIRDKWNEVTTATQEVFKEKPSVVAPYAAGALSEDFLTSGITYLNYIRFVANLPAVQLNATLNEDAQHGAVVMAANDELSHYPQRPNGMSDDFYNRGYRATSTSNIFWGYGYPQKKYLQVAIDGFMDDDVGISNLSKVGHRRWLLNPPLLNVGFGYAKSAGNGHYVDTKVFDFSGASINYDYISWPASGNFPNHLLGNTVPWSVSLNPRKYQNPNRELVKITVTRQSDGKSWIFDNSTAEVKDCYTKYLHVDLGGYGVSNAIIFHLGANDIKTYEGIFTVKITGIYTASGAPTSLEYQVDFFDVTNVACSHNYVSVVTAPTCTQKGYTTHTCAHCGDKYTDNYVNPTGKHIYSDEKDTTCNVCGASRGRVAVYRLYNPYTYEHLMTSGLEEKDLLLSVGWELDGVAWDAPETGTPVYRLYNPYDDWHTYTVSEDEKNTMVAAGWKLDGVVSRSAAKESGKPIYRLFNPYVRTNFHLFTAGEEERDSLVSVGWELEGIAWYALNN